MVKPPEMKYCNRCCYPIIAATPIILDEQGICSGCRTYEEQDTIDWSERRIELKHLLAQYKTKDGYDCIIPVSGGKDSFYQVYVIVKEFKLNPLLITYNEDHETDVGRRNIQRMKEVFNCDYINFTPSINVLRRLNKIGFLNMGDPDMQAHFGIFTYPMQVAIEKKIPLIVWGEMGFTNLGGMHSYSDMVEFTAKYRREHNLRGYDYEDFLKMGFEAKEIQWMKYPSDEDIKRVGLRGIYLSNYLGWHQSEHTKLMKDLYGFEENDKPFERTFLRDSNLNNWVDTNLHDYLKFVKWGYGRVNDHTSRLIREGLMTRENGVKLVLEYEHAYPERVREWLHYARLTKEEFENTCDRFRDPRVWVKDEGGSWWKWRIDGKFVNYGPGRIICPE